MSDGPRTIVLPATFQGNCWNENCPDSILFDFGYVIERGGLRCKRCGFLNVYNWTDAEFETEKKRHEEAGDVIEITGFRFIKTKPIKSFNIVAWAKRFGIRYLPETKDRIDQ